MVKISKIFVIQVRDFKTSEYVACVFHNSYLLKEFGLGVPFLGGAAKVSKFENFHIQARGFKTSGYVFGVSQK